MNLASFSPANLELLERNRGRIDRLCRSWWRTDADRDDLRSEVLLQHWRSLPGFSGRSTEDTYRRHRLDGHAHAGHGVRGLALVGGLLGAIVPSAAIFTLIGWLVVRLNRHEVKRQLEP